MSNPKSKRIGQIRIGDKKDKATGQPLLENGKPVKYSYIKIEEDVVLRKGDVLSLFDPRAFNESAPEWVKFNIVKYNS